MAVERKDIEIFFKIEGLEAYIADLETLDSVLKQVNTATKQAKDATDQLEASTESFDDLESKLQAMEGGVKALAGGLEFLTGAVGLLGLEDNPFFAELEQNTLQVLALARGAIDLSEGVSILAKNQKIAAAAQAAFNAVANANPYVLLATAIITAAGAIALLATKTEDTTAATKAYTQSLKDEQTELEDTIDFQKRLAEARGEASPEDQATFNRAEAAGLQSVNDKISDQIYLLNQRYGDLSDEEKTELETLRATINENNAKINQLNQENILIDARTETKKREAAAEAEADRQREAAQRAKELRDAQNALTAELQLKQFEEGRSREIEELRRRYEEEVKIAKGNAELLKLVEEDLRRSLKEINDKYKIEPLQPLKVENLVPEDAFETTVERLRRLRQEIEATKQLIVNTNDNVGTTTIAAADTLAVEYKKAFDQIVEEPGKASELIKRDVSAALTFANNLNEIFTKDNEKRAERNFKIQKALSLSTAIINTAEAITTALTDRTQPSTLIRILQTAAVAAAGAAQIATISRQQFKPGSVSPTTPPPVPPPPSPTGVGGGGPTIQPGQTSSGQSIQPEPVRAYVLVSDVNNAQQANQQIENLAKL
jgi:hypothetical protein